MIYQARPTQISAEQFTGNNWDRMTVYAGSNFHKIPEEVLREAPMYYPYKSGIVAEVWDKLHNTWVGVKVNDYIICGTKGEFYPCDPEVFNAKYEEVK